MVSIARSGTRLLLPRFVNIASFLLGSAHFHVARLLIIFLFSGFECCYSETVFEVIKSFFVEQVFGLFFACWDLCWVCSMPRDDVHYLSVAKFAIIFVRHKCYNVNVSHLHT